MTMKIHIHLAKRNFNFAKGNSLSLKIHFYLTVQIFQNIACGTPFKPLLSLLSQAILHPKENKPTFTSLPAKYQKNEEIEKPQDLKATKEK